MQNKDTTGKAAHELLACDRCGQLVESLADVLTDGGETAHWCAECALQHTATCARCGQLVDEDAAIYAGGSYWEPHVHVVVCPSCVGDADVQPCAQCGEPHMPFAMRDVVVDGEVQRWCGSCCAHDAIECDDCGVLFADWTGEARTHDTRDCDGDYTELTLCGRCLERDYVTCESCGCVVAEEDAEYDEGHGYMCSRCGARHYLHGYGHTSATTYSSVGDWDRARMLYLGVELEVEDDTEEAPAELARDVMTSGGGRWSDVLVCKEDGSLSSDGVEVVSQPGTPEWHLEEGGVWDDVLEACRARGARSHDGGNCGLHVHINRRFLRCAEDSPDSAGERAAYVLDRLMQGHAPEWRRFSRRGSNLGYCRMYQVSDDGYSDADFYTDCSSFTSKFDKLKRAKGCDRYQAINTTNYRTVEVRLWRGTLKRSTFRATLEATTALALVARAIAPWPDAVETLSWADLKVEMRAALDAEGLSHEDLDAYLVERGL